MKQAYPFISYKVSYYMEEKTSLLKNSGIDKHTYIKYNISVDVGDIL